MSCDYRDYGFTEDEYSSGVAALVAGCYDEEESDTNHIQISAEAYEKSIKLIAGLSNNTQIKNKIVKQLFLDNMDYMIATYAKLEHLPDYYIVLSKHKNCIEVLIKGFLMNEGGYILTSDIVREINTFSDKILLNLDDEIVYRRVQKIQKFIHEKIDIKHGKYSYLELPAKKMQYLLSSSRLHLNLNDIKNKDMDALIHTINESEIAARLEEKYPTEMFSSDKEIYTTKKRIRDMKSLVDFGYYDIQHKIFDISRLDINIPVEYYKIDIINIYGDAKYGYTKDGRVGYRPPEWLELD